MGSDKIDPGKLQLLQSMPIFGAVQSDVLQKLLQHCNHLTVEKGQHFFLEGDLAQSMFVLEKGHVVVYRKWDGLLYKLRELQAGDCFGEMALMDCKPRSASVQAVENCQAIEIGASQLSGLYEHFPEQYVLIQMNMGREVCRRLREADERLFEKTVGANEVELV